MERTIDRASYRRNTREVKEQIETKNKFSYISIVLNQIIVSLLIIICILTFNYFEFNIPIEWIKNNMSKGNTLIETFSLLKNRYIDSGDNILNNTSMYDLINGTLVSGDVNMSGDNLNNIYSGDSGEFSKVGDGLDGSRFITAVEGVNQMSEDAKYVKDNYDFTLPLKGVVTSQFGCRISENEIVSSYHTGLDIAANTGTNILSAHDGIVTMSRVNSTYGKCVIIENGELMTLYAHCSSLNVKEGQKVKKGDIIAKVGTTGNSTGPHLHFEIKYQERYINPQDVLEVN